MRSAIHKVQTTKIPKEMTAFDLKEAASAVGLHYKNGEFFSQSLFTPPHLGEINWVEGLEPKADVYFRSIYPVGPNLFFLRLVGKEAEVKAMFAKKDFFKLVRGIGTSFEDGPHPRRYLDVADWEESWEVLVSPEKKAFRLLNLVGFGKKKARMTNTIVVSDRAFGLIDGKVFSGKLTPELFDKDEIFRVEPVDEINSIGEIDMLQALPNCEDSFVVGRGDMIYQFNVWGEFLTSNRLEENARIHSIDFNRRKSILATDDGIFEVGVQEMPNMVKVASLPRRIVHPELKGKFQFAHYVEDPNVLGVNPAMSVFAKTEDARVVCF